MHGFKVLGKKIYLSVVMALFLLLNGNDSACKRYTGCSIFPSSKPSSDSYDHLGIEVPKLVKLIKKCGKFFFVWLHGMFEDNTRWEDLVPNIIRTDPLRNVYHRIEPMFVKSRETKIKTAFHAIPKQADLAVEDIKKGVIAYLEKLLGQEYPSLTKLQKSEAAALGVKYVPIALGGFSQGGLVAAMIGYNNTKKYGLNIKGMVCLQTPFNGVLAFEPSFSDVAKFAYEGSKGLNKLGMSAAASMIKMFGAKAGVKFSKLLSWFGYETAIESMRPNSKSIDFCHKFVRKNEDAEGKQHNIPIFLMSGCIKDPLRYFPCHSNNEKKVKKFVRALGKFINGRLHDGVVSLESQLCISKIVPDDFSRANCLQHIADEQSNYVMRDKLRNLEVYIAQEDVWHGRHGIKPIFTILDNFEAVEGSKEMFDYEESKYRFGKWLFERFDAWEQEA